MMFRRAPDPYSIEEDGFILLGYWSWAEDLHMDSSRFVDTSPLDK